MTRTSNYLRALPLAAALLAGCAGSPLEPIPGDRTIWVEDEPELEVFLIRRTSPVDTLGVIAGGVSDGVAASVAAGAR